MAHLFNESAEIVGNNSEGFSSSEEWETMSHTLQESKLYTTTESDSVSTHSESTNEPSEMEPSEFDQNEIGLVKTGNLSKNCPLQRKLFQDWILQILRTILISQKLKNVLQNL